MDKALIVAIDTCPAAPRLRGCKTDAHSLAARVVQRYGFMADRVRLLFDARATAAAIRERIGWLTDDVGPDDRVLFAFSGHGARQTFRGAGGLPAGTHECLVPYDFAWDSPDRCIPDTWLADMFRTPSFQGVKTVLLDCCHSGGMDRSFVRRVTRRARVARGIEPPADVAWHRQRRAPCSPAPLSCGGFTLIAACTAEQTASDCYEAGAWRGAHTWALGETLDQGGARAPLSVLQDAEHKFLTRHGYHQDPRFVGTGLGRPFLGGPR